MFRQISIGAAAVLTVGLLAAGCSEDGDTIISGGTSELNNSDAFGATSIASNNLAPDGGGMSPDDTSVNGERVIWCCDAPDSDGPSDADGSAILLFTTTDGRTFASHYNGQSLTPPVELEANDHNQGSAFNINAAVALCLQTASYENAQASTDTINQVRENDGVWLLVMSGQTSFEDPRTTQTQLIKGLRGRHIGLWSWIVDPSKRGTASVFVDGVTNTIGSLPATSPRNGEYRYGFQVNAGDEIAAGFGSATTSPRSGATPANRGGVLPTDPATPASDVQVFGLISDGISGQATYSGGTGASSTTGGRAVATTGGGPTSSDYEGGENTNVVHLYYTQTVTSNNLGGGFVNSVHGGTRIAGFQSGFNLATLTFGAVGEVLPTTRVTDNAAPANAGLQMFVDTDPNGVSTSFLTYNQFLFFPYTDLTLNNTVGGDPYLSLDGETIIAKAVVRQDSSGGSTLLATQDLTTRNGTLGAHDLISRTTFSNAETQTFISDDESQSIYGTDEGLADTTIFYIGSDNTQTGGIDDTAAFTGNSDDMLLAANFTTLDVTVATGAQDDVLLAGSSTTSSGFLVSAHDQDLDASSGSASSVVEFDDGVSDVSLRMDRAGRYVAAAYRQNQGASTTTNFTQHTALMARIYQVVRFGGAAVAFTSRFSNITQVSQTGATVEVNDVSATQITDALSVQGYTFQDYLGYRCGVQSDADIMWLIWDQSDGTEDRLFVRPLITVVGATGTPLVNTAGTATSNVVELEDAAGQAVSGDDHDTLPGTAGGEINSFNFINNSIDEVLSCDLGAAGSSTGTQTLGGLFLAFVKVTDATSPSFFSSTSTNLGDADGFDADVIAVAVLPGASDELNRVVIDNGFNEDADDSTPRAFASNLNSGGGDLTGTNLRTGEDVFELVVTDPTTDITTIDNGSDAIVVLWTEPTARSNGTGSDGLFAVKFASDAFASTINGNTSTGSATDFANAFVPDLLLLPNRLDHLTGGDVTGLVPGDNPTTAGSNVGVLFLEDSRIWAQGSTDGGATWLTSSGAPDPALVDNDTTSNVIASEVSVCWSDDCEATDGILAFRKFDTQSAGAELRLRLRTGFRPAR